MNPTEKTKEMVESSREETKRIRKLLDTPLHKKVPLGDYAVMIIMPLVVTVGCFLYLHNTVAGIVSAWMTVLSILMVAQGIMLREAKEIADIAIKQRNDAMGLADMLSQITEGQLRRAVMDCMKQAGAEVWVVNDPEPTKH